MLTFTTGDMFTVPSDIQVNTVNCVGVMGAGVALAFKKKFPDMYEHYKKECSAGRVKPGYLDIWKTPDGIQIINFPTKRHWKEKSRYEDIEAGLIALRKYLQSVIDGRPLRITLPALGCGHGGLDWKLVSEMIQKYLYDIQADILVFEPSASISIGNSVKAQDEQEAYSKLTSQGVLFWKDIMTMWPAQRQRSANTERISIFGNNKVLLQDFVFIMSSIKPSAKEFMAAAVCVENIAKPGIVLGLIHGSKLSSKLCLLALSQGASILLGVSEGMIRYKLQKGLEKYKVAGQLCIVSVGDPLEKWNPPLAKKTILLLVQSAKVLVTTSQSPDRYLKDCVQSSINLKQKFYIKYQETTQDHAEEFNTLGMRPIGRNAATGLPNMAPVSSALGPRLDHVHNEDPKNLDDEDSHMIGYSKAATKSNDLAIQQPLALFANSRW